MLHSHSDYFELFAQYSARKDQSMDWSSAVDFMKKLKTLTTLKLDHQDDGCLERCLLIMRLLQERNIKSGVVTIEGSQKGFLLNGHTEPFNYHFAAYGKINTGQNVVFDPLLDAPETIDEWIQKMCDAGADRNSFRSGDDLDVFNFPSREWRAANDYIKNIAPPLQASYS